MIVNVYPTFTNTLIPWTPVTIPTSQTTTSVTINYTYDALYRLTGADYSDGTFFHYTYDAVGNRLTQQTVNFSHTYNYDAANRLAGVDGVASTWDANGNLLSDGVNTYAYDSANRLTAVSGNSNSRLQDLDYISCSLTTVP